MRAWIIPVLAAVTCSGDHTDTATEPAAPRACNSPSDDGEDERHTLHLPGGVATDVPIHVIDQDLNTPITSPINVDLSLDRASPDGTHFFLDDPVKQAIVVQARTGCARRPVRSRYGSWCTDA